MSEDKKLVEGVDVVWRVMCCCGGVMVETKYCNCDRMPAMNDDDIASTLQQLRGAASENCLRCNPDGPRYR